ncbi:YCF48-related protein [Parasediminibacterium sp. JCM 36343]|uniref:YCF48-related protein n=1 Tax=Parasediminibacterium sp. JCM 36343 TaxID=3374279 RepID=UPI0039793583
MQKIYVKQVVISLVTCFFLLSFGVLKAQTWSTQTSGTTKNLFSVYFANQTTGWAVGASGTILNTTDGGSTWTSQSVGTNNFNSVRFTDANFGCAVGNRGTIITTNNGGSTWNMQSSGTTATLYSVFFVSSTQGWAVGAGSTGIILTTIDGGSTWVAQTSGTTASLSSVFFVSATQGWATGSGGTILTTIDGGSNWVAQTSGTTNRVLSLYFVNATTGWASCGNGQILKTTDGGNTWVSTNSNTTVNLSSIYFTSATQGWAVGASGTILTTTDGGNTWTTQASGITNYLNSIYFVNASHGWAVATNGPIINFNAPCTATTSTTTITSTNASYTWNGTTYTTAGTYTKTFAGGNSVGCDSVATLNLSFASPSAFTYTTPNTFTAGTAITPLSPTAQATVSTLGSGFNSASGVAVDAAGNIYVADQANNAVKKIATNGTITTLGSGFNTPTGVALDAAGNVYVADYGNSMLKKIDTNGNITSILACTPFGVALDAAGNVYTTDVSKGTVEKIATNGNVTTLATGLNVPHGLAVDAQGNVYVAEDSNNDIKKIATNGSITTVASGFSAPQGVAIDASGNIYVADLRNNAIKKIATNGTTTTLYSGFKAAGAPPNGIALDAAGNIYVVSQYINPITKILIAGEVSSYSISPTLPTGLSFNTTTGVISGTPYGNSSSTTYTVTASNGGGNVSSTLSITVNCTNTYSTTIVTDVSFPYTWNGNTYTHAGNYSTTFTNANGCDSIANLAINNSSISRFYVNKSVVGGNGDGSSWANAYTEMGEALLAAQNNPAVKEIWVAKGTYLPTRDFKGKISPTDIRTKTFYLRNNLAIYGGFAGTETILSQRNYTTNTTTLSGDFNGDDVVTGTGKTLSFTNNTENAYHVLEGILLDSTAYFDGFTIKGGYANGSSSDTTTINGTTYSILQTYGGGFNEVSSYAKFSNNIFTENAAGYAGGIYANGISAQPGIPTLTNNTFSLNNALNGGGIYAVTGSYYYSNCSFIGNAASISGGGIYQTSALSRFLNCVVTGNYVTNTGAGVLTSFGGASFINSVISNNTAGASLSSGAAGGFYNVRAIDTLIGCVLSGNTCGIAGGAILNNTGSSIYITNCTIWGNTATSVTGRGGGLYAASSTTTVSNSILYNNTTPNNATDAGTEEIYNTTATKPVKLTNSLVREALPITNVTDGGGNINSYPQFKDTTNPIGADGIWGTADDGLQLNCSSPAVNAGNNDSVTVSTDLIGNARIYGSKVDMGAYEKIGAATSSTTTITTCSFPYTWNGTTYNAAGTYTYTTTNSQGCDSVATLVLSVSPTRYYVNKNVVGGNGDGSSWANAYTELGEALWAAQSNCVSEIWVAKGTYLPTRDPKGLTSPTEVRDKTFYLRNGVALYGGFNGTETSLSQRDYATNTTILSGDLNGDDVVTGSGKTLNFANGNDNVFSILLSIKDDSTTQVDGFKLMNGNKYSTTINGISFKGDTLEGLALDDFYGNPLLQSAITLKHLTITNCATPTILYSSNPTIDSVDFINNYTSGRGGAISIGNSYNISVPATIINHASFIGNYAVGGGSSIASVNANGFKLLNAIFQNNYGSSGAGVFVQGSGSYEITNSVFSNNAGSNGGAIFIFNNTATTISNCEFSSNATTGGGGAITLSTTNTSIINCIFNKNTCVNTGAAISAGASTVKINNATFWGNQATNTTSRAGGIYFNNSTATVNNSILYNNTTPNNATDAGTEEIYNTTSTKPVKLNNCIVREALPITNVTDLGGNSSSYPQFKDTTNPIGADGIWGTADDGLQLNCSSPAINAGNNDSVTVSTDLIGNARIYGSTVDMGAYEKIGAATSSTTTQTASGSYTWNGTTYTTSGTYTYTTTNSAGCDSTATLNLTITASGITWTGTTSANWSTASNWSNNAVPTSTDSVTIPRNGGGNEPVISGTASIKYINIGSGRTLSIIGMLNLYGTISNGGNLFANNGTVAYVGSTAQSIDDGNFTSNSIKKLTINNAAGVSLNANLSVTGTLTLTAGTFNTNDNLTLKSTSIANTAVVGPVSGSITGKVTVERFIPQGLRVFRDLGAGLANAGSIFSNWQEGGVNNNGYGIPITGSQNTSAGTNPTTGLDYTGTGNHSMYTFTNSNWDSVLNTKTTNLDPYQGYRVLIRGNRAVNLFQSPQPAAMLSPATIRTTGNLVTGTVTFGTGGVSASTNSSYHLTSGASAFSFVANPYICPIDWSSIYASSSNIGSSFWYAEPTFLTGGYTTYVTYNASSGTSSNPLGSRLNQYIQPGQAFFIQNDSTGSAPELVIKESDKAPNASKLAIFGSTPVNRIAIGLYKGGNNVDGAVAVFSNSFSPAISKEDSRKFSNGGENIALKQGNTDLSINGLGLPKATDNIPLHLYQIQANTTYTIRIDASQFAANGLQAYLKDKVTGKQTLLSGDSTVVVFTATKDTATYNSRFSIVFGTVTLPVSSIKLTATPASNGSVKIDWATIGEANVASYTVEHGTDGAAFTAIATQRAANTATAAYSYTDANAAAGANYYRIKATDNNGAVTYSNVVALTTYNVERTTFSVYPNPVKGSSLSLRLSNLDNGQYTVSLVNKLGQTVLSKAISHNGAAVEKISIGKGLAAGTYTIRLSNNSGTILQAQVVKE